MSEVERTPEAKAPPPGWSTVAIPSRTVGDPGTRVWVNAEPSEERVVSTASPNPLLVVRDKLAGILDRAGVKRPQSLHPEHLAAALMPAVADMLIVAWRDGYDQAVSDHKMRLDGEPHCDWPTSPNPYDA